MDKRFFAFVDDQNKCVFLNFDQIRTVVCDDNSCEIRFSETHTHQITGEGAAELMARMLERAVALNGKPLDPAMFGNQPSKIH